LATETKTAGAPAALQDTDGEAFIIDEASDEVLRLQLDQFEGPFEVLLYLIRSQELDIFDIPILKVTEQYLRFLELMREENLDVAGEFLVMAATLIQIKSRMVLPVEVEEEEEEIEEEDPRLELVEKLLEYRKYRDLCEALGKLEEANFDSYSRLVKPRYEVVESEEDISDVTLYDLSKALRAVLRYLLEPPVHEVHGEGHTVDEKIGYIEEFLERADSLVWAELLAVCKGKVEIICCLLAILELCRMRKVRVHQHQNFGDIRLVRRPQEDDLDADMATTTT
jgi:segregation and condensation protein A